MTTKRLQDFTLQFHVTESCMYQCSHCYIGIDRQPQSVLSTDDAFRVIDGFTDFISVLSSITGDTITPRIHFTGGDPLLRKDIFQLIEYAVSKKIKCGILGNPDLLTKEICEQIKSLGVVAYQISLDGLRDVHDSFRKKSGSFDKSLEALSLLHDAGVYRTYIMCNVSKSNLDQIIPLYRVVKSHKAYGFVIARVSCTGSAVSVDTDIFPFEYRRLFEQLSDEVGEITRDLCKNELNTTKLVLKDPLWSLYAYENKLRVPTETVEGGCQAGISIMTIMPDGTCHACRRLNVPIGKFPDDSFLKMYASNNLMKSLRNFSNFDKCGNCELVNNCRGCPAVVHSKFGDPFVADPQCWKVC